MSVNNSDLEKKIPSAFSITLLIFGPIAFIAFGILLLDPNSRGIHQTNMERYRQIKAEDTSSKVHTFEASKKVHTFNDGDFIIQVVVD